MKELGFELGSKLILGIPGGSDDKESVCNTGDGFDPWVGKIPWRREWLYTPVFLPGESQGRRSLAGYSSWRHKELDMTDQLTHSLFHFQFIPKLRSSPQRGSLFSSFLFLTLQPHSATLAKNLDTVVITFFNICFYLKDSCFIEFCCFPLMNQP